MLIMKNRHEFKARKTHQKYFPCCFAPTTLLPVKAFSTSAAEVPTFPKTLSSCWALTNASVLPTRCSCR